VLDTHAGAGLYRLDGDYARTSGEAGEGILRLTRAYHSRLDEAATEPLLDLIRDRLRALGIDPDQPLPEGLRTTLASAVNSASQIRDRFSVDGWAALKDLEK